MSEASLGRSLRLRGNVNEIGSLESKESTLIGHRVVRCSKIEAVIARPGCFNSDVPFDGIDQPRLRRFGGGKADVAFTGGVSSRLHSSGSQPPRGY